jgi:hypothetical protein
MFAACNGHDAVVEHLLAVGGERLDLNLRDTVSVIGVCTCVCVAV